MDFQQAIQAHVKWKTTLASYIAKPDHSLNAQAVSQDANCDLAGWLKGVGRKYATTPEFASLIAAHARFHTAAGDVIRRATPGRA